MSPDIVRTPKQGGTTCVGVRGITRVLALRRVYLDGVLKRHRDEPEKIYLRRLLRR